MLGAFPGGLSPSGSGISPREEIVARLAASGSAITRVIDGDGNCGFGVVIEGMRRPPFNKMYRVGQLRSIARMWMAHRPEVFMPLRLYDLCAYDSQREPAIALTEEEFEDFLADVGHKDSKTWMCQVVLEALSQALDFSFCALGVKECSTKGGHPPGCFIVGNSNAFDAHEQRKDGRIIHGYFWGKHCSCCPSFRFRSSTFI